MKEIKAPEYRQFEEIKHSGENGEEYWSARELAPVLDYSKWENFLKVIERAMLACNNSGHDVKHDFVDANKISIRKSSKEKMT
jgi:DNA-damage-inducible protein D